MAKLEIEPLSRLEGHGKISLIFDDNGKFKDAYMQVSEFLGYEKLVEKLPIEEVPRIASTICGVCRTVHFNASLKAVDQIFGVKKLPKTAKLLRELILLANHIEDHTTIFVVLGLVDFLLYDAPKKEKNLIGLIKVLGEDVLKTILEKRFSAVKIVEIIGGKPVHPAGAIPGGWGKVLKKEEQEEILRLSKDCIELGKLMVDIIENILLKNEIFLKFLNSKDFEIKTNYLATLDEKGNIAYYDGSQTIMDMEGNILAQFKGKEYLNYIEEKVFSWSYAKFPYFKKLGWKGFLDGKGTSLIATGPLARFNMGYYSTFLARKFQKKLLEYFGKRIIHNIFAYHLARAIEILNQAELIYEIVSKNDLTNKDICAPKNEITQEGIGILEAPRGTLIHHYQTDENGFVTNANMIVPTTINNAAIQIAVKRGAKFFFENKNINEIKEEDLLKLEIVSRPFDLCLACSTH